MKSNMVNLSNVKHRKRFIVKKILLDNDTIKKLSNIGIFIGNEIIVYENILNSNLIKINCFNKVYIIRKNDAEKILGEIVSEK